MVTHLLWEDLAVHGAQIETTTGGPRGMRVTVTLPAADRASVPDVEKALAGYLFEAQVIAE